MNSKEPMGRKPFDICSPISKGDIQDENQYGGNNKCIHNGFSKIPTIPELKECHRTADYPVLLYSVSVFFLLLSIFLKGLFLVYQGLPVGLFILFG